MVYVVGLDEAPLRQKEKLSFIILSNNPVSHQPENVVWEETFL